MSAPSRSLDPGSTSWDGRSDVGPWVGPYSSNEEAKTQQALLTPLMNHAACRAVRPPLPQIRLNPSRHGYGPRVLGINDVISVGRDYTPHVDWSGGIGSYSGASRNAEGAI